MENLEDFICQSDIEDVDKQVINYIIIVIKIINNFSKVRKCAGQTDGFIYKKRAWFFDPLYRLYGNFTLDTECQMKVYAKMDERMEKAKDSSANRKLLHKHYLNAARTYFDPNKYPDNQKLESFEKSWFG